MTTEEVSVYHKEFRVTGEVDSQYHQKKELKTVNFKLASDLKSNYKPFE